MATATINGMSTFGSSGSGADAGWGDIGAGPGGGQNTDDFVEGTDSFGGRKTASGRGLAYTAGAGVDMSTTTTHIYCWINCKSIGSLDTLANGGMILRVGSSSANYRSFYIGGSNTVKAGWQLYVIDPTLTGSVADTGTPNMASVTYIGVELTIASAVGGTSDNILMDIIRYTTGPYITGGTSGDRLLWSDIATADAASAYGLVQERSGVYFCAGQIALGAPSGTGDCYLDDGGQILVWEPKEYEDGTNVVTALAAGFNSLVIQEGTGTTDVEDGILVGSGDDRSGVGGSVFRKAGLGITGAANTNTLDLDFSGTITAVDMHGSTFVAFDGTTTTLSNDATDGPNHVYAGCTWSECEMIDSGRVVLRNCTFAGYTGTQGALNWEANANVRNSNFLGNTDATNDPAGVYHQTEGDFSYIGLLFSGNDIDVRNANNATSVQSYPNTNQDSELAIGNGTTDAAGQSFAASAGQLVKAMFHLRKVGTPTGNATVNLYAHSGTFGTSSVPTGASLVATGNFDVSTLTGTLADVEFVFQAAEFYDLLAATNYVIVLDCGGITGDGSNYVAVGYDNSAPTSAGNASTQATAGGGWTAQSYDLIHQVWRDGEVQVNASSGSDPSTVSNTGSPSSATAIINTVSLTVEVLDAAGLPIQNAQTAIYATETAGGVTLGDELLSGSGGLDTNASGIAQNAGFNYGGAVDIEVRVRKSSTGATKYIPVEAAGAIGSGGFSTTITLREDPNA